MEIEIDSVSSPSKVKEIDGLLADVGYKVKSSELHQVAQNIERLENVIVNSSSSDISQFASDTVHYDPSDIGNWVDNLLSEFDHTNSLPYDFSQLPLPDLAQDQHQHHHHQLKVVTTVEEDSAIKLVHTLMTCADSLQRGNIQLAGSLIEGMQGLLANMNTNSGIGKVAGYFIDALNRRIFGQNNIIHIENDVLYHHYYEA
ncbi:DELLA protein RHT-1-like, partial [Trifolium medium]|nr:DELLA protein RHT-1-like [Trifolium medium]